VIAEVILGDESERGRGGGGRRCYLAKLLSPPSACGLTRIARGLPVGRRIWNTRDQVTRFSKGARRAARELGCKNKRPEPSGPGRRPAHRGAGSKRKRPGSA